MQMDINKTMTNVVFTMNDKHTQLENEHNKLQHQANHA